MIEVFTFLASVPAVSSGPFANIFAQWDQIGVFSFILPLLIIFALIFGLLTKMNLFGVSSSAVNSIIALGVAFIAARSGIVAIFFQDLFPKLGVGLAVVLVALIFMGMVMGKRMMAIMFYVAAAAAAFAIFTSLNSLNGFFTGIKLSSTYVYGGIAGLLILIAVAVVVSSVKPTPPEGNAYSDSILARTLNSAQQ